MVMRGQPLFFLGHLFLCPFFLLLFCFYLKTLAGLGWQGARRERNGGLLWLMRHVELGHRGGRAKHGIWEQA